MSSATSKLGLGLDAGGSSTRWVLTDCYGREHGRGEAPSMTGHVFTEEGLKEVNSSVAQVAAKTRLSGDVTSVFAGITGTDENASSAEIIRQILSKSFSLPMSGVRVVGDLWIAYISRFDKGQGILVYSGTGSAAIHVTITGETIQVGGLGYLIDDGGSGFAIARDALKTILRAEEVGQGSGWNSIMGQAIARRIGSSSWDDVRKFVYSGTRSGVASLAKPVGDSAIQGDHEARRILANAGSELGRLASILSDRVGQVDVSLAGRAAQLPFVAVAAAETLSRSVDTSPRDAALAASRASSGLEPEASRSRIGAQT